MISPTRNNGYIMPIYHILHDYWTKTTITYVYNRYNCILKPRLTLKLFININHKVYRLYKQCRNYCFRYSVLEW